MTVLAPHGPNLSQTYTILITAMQLHELFEATRIQFGEFNKFYFLIFTKCRKSSESTIRPSCNYFECHNVTQYCPVANIIIMYVYL